MGTSREEALGEEDRNVEETREVITEDGRKKRVKKNSNSRQVKPKTHPRSCKPKTVLKEGTNIKIHLEGEEVGARVTGRGKVSGSFYNYFNIRDQRLDWNVNLESSVWSRTEDGNFNNGAASSGVVVIFLRSGDVAVPLLWYVNKVKRVCNSSTQ